jgi:hypothetical protein
MDISIFTDKKVIPTNNDLAGALAGTFDLWQVIIEYVHLKYPAAVDEWKYSGANYGWSFRIKDKKRVIVYLLPRDRFFKVAFVFGQKATDRIMKSRISGTIKSELDSARVYAEGRGIRIDIQDKMVIEDIKELIDIKIAN